MSGGPKQPGEGELVICAVPSSPARQAEHPVLRPYPQLSLHGPAVPRQFPGEGFLPPGQVRLFSSLREEMRQRTCCPHAKGRQTGPC